MRFALNFRGKLIISEDFSNLRQSVTAFTSTFTVITRILRLYYAFSVHSITRVATFLLLCIHTFTGNVKLIFH